MAIVLLDIFSIIVTFSAWIVLTFFSRRPPPLPKRQFWLLMLAACVAQCLGYAVYSSFFGTSLSSVNLYYWLLTALRTVMVFCIYRRQVFQNLFFMFSTWVCIAFVFAVGTIAETALAGQPLFYGRLINRVVVLVFTCLMLPPMSWVLRRLQRQMSSGYNKVPLWRLLWIPPFCLLVLFVLTSPQIVGGLQLPGILVTTGVLFVTRVLILLSLWVVCYTAAEVMRYSRSAEAARLEADALKEDMAQREKLLASIPKENLVSCGTLTLNTLANQAFMGNTDLLLAPKEFALLLLLLQHEGELLSRSDMYETVWRQPYSPKDQALKSCLSRLRIKVQDSGYQIEAERGKGYRFSKLNTDEK